MHRWLTDQARLRTLMSPVLLPAAANAPTERTRFWSTASRACSSSLASRTIVDPSLRSAKSLTTKPQTRLATPGALTPSP